MWLADIAPLRRMPSALSFLTYLIPDEVVSDIVRGSVVRIPFRNQTLTGIVLRTYRADPPPHCKSLHSALNVTLPVSTIDVLLQSADYFATSVSSLAHALLPVPGKRFMPQTNAFTATQVPRSNRPKQVLFEAASPTDLFSTLQQTVSEYLALGLAVHILVPGVSQAQDMQKKLAHFGSVALITGELAPGIRWNLLTRCLGISESKPIDILITTRSGVLYPLQRRGIFIVLDDASDDHKQWDMNPRYDARTMVSLYAAAEGIDECHISLAPRLQSYIQFQWQTQLQTVPNIIVHVNPDTRHPLSTPTQDAVDEATDAGKKILHLPMLPILQGEEGARTIEALADADLVVLLYPDQFLYGNEWSAEERLFGRLLHLVKCMKSSATLIIVARSAHRVFAGLMPGRRKAYLQKLLDERKEHGYPPFGTFVKLIAQSALSMQDAMLTAEGLIASLKLPRDVEVLGPYPSEPVVVRGRYRSLFLLKGAPAAISTVKPLLARMGDKVLIDIDPERIFR